MNTDKSKYEVYVAVTRLFEKKQNFNMIKFGFVVREQGFYCTEKWVREAVNHCIKNYGYGKILGDDVYFE
jgi:uncharacterized alpha/beta hydrolase family protein